MAIKKPGSRNASPGLFLRLQPPPVIRQVPREIPIEQGRIYRIKEYKISVLGFEKVLALSSCATAVENRSLIGLPVYRVEGRNPAHTSIVSLSGTNKLSHYVQETALWCIWHDSILAHSRDKDVSFIATERDILLRSLRSRIDEALNNASFHPFHGLEQGRIYSYSKSQNGPVKHFLTLISNQEGLTITHLKPSDKQVQRMESSDSAKDCRIGLEAKTVQGDKWSIFFGIKTLTPKLFESGYLGNLKLVEDISRDSRWETAKDWVRGQVNGQYKTGLQSTIKY